MFVQENKSRKIKKITFNSDNYKHGILNQIKLFIKSIEQDKEFLPNFEDSLQSMKLVKRFMNKKNYIAFIPAKGNSERLKNKNLFPIGKKN